MATHSAIQVTGFQIVQAKLIRDLDKAVSRLQRIDQRLGKAIYRWAIYLWTVSGWMAHREIVKENKKRGVSRHRITGKTLRIHRWPEMRLCIGYVSRCS